MDVGIVGKPGSGRTTLFGALLAHKAEAAGRGSDIGRIRVADERLEDLGRKYQPEKLTPIEIRLHDLCPSLEPSFPTAELEAMKRMDLLLLVLPAFADPSPAASVRAFDGLLADLCIEDLAAVESLLKRTRLEKGAALQREALETAHAALDGEPPRPVRAAGLSEPQAETLRGYGLVTDRGLIAVRNAGEGEAAAAPPEELLRRAEEVGVPVVSLCASLEAEMAELPAEERADFLEEYDLSEAAGARLTQLILERADLISFFTVGEDECRAWGIRRGTAAREAAGKIHSDIERGFIRAEVVPYEDLAPLRGGMTEARQKGLLRLEGKDYVVRDGEVVHFRFNV